MLLRLRQTYAELKTQDGRDIFDAELTDFRLTWQFNIRSFLRFTVQRQKIERNLDVFVNGIVT